jgi:hypothetical protein
MNNRKLAHNGFTPPLLQSQRMCWSPMELQKAETSMSDELSTCWLQQIRSLMQSTVRLEKLFLDILPIRSWFIYYSITGTLSPWHHRKFPPCRTQTSPPWGRRTRLQLAQRSSKFSRWMKWSSLIEQLVHVRILTTGCSGDYSVSKVSGFVSNIWTQLGCQTLHLIRLCAIEQYRQPLIFT